MNLPYPSPKWRGTTAIIFAISCFCPLGKDRQYFYKTI